jgi:L-ascorbate metabolism protein UlaG (beta-lactamase superfamily)
MFSRRKFLTTLALAAAAVSAGATENRTRRRERWEMLAHDDVMQPAPVKPDPAAWDTNTITAAWIGHATVLINFFGMNIITDPVLSSRIGLNIAGLFTIGPRRLVAPALTFEELPPIDLLLLSHAHLDHLDVPTLDRFDRSIPVVLAANTYDVISRLGFETVFELDWGRWTTVGDLRVEALQVKHFGWRYPWEHDRSRGNPDGRSYNAYLLSRRGRHLVFGGDTAYHEHFRMLADRGLRIDLAVMPIGAYDPWIRNHASPEQALSMSDHMGAGKILPIHWNTFIQSQEPTGEPMERLKRAAAPGRIVLDTIGQTWTCAGIPGVAASPSPASSPSINGGTQ